MGSSGWSVWCTSFKETGASSGEHFWWGCQLLQAHKISVMC